MNPIDETKEAPLPDAEMGQAATTHFQDETTTESSPDKAFFGRSKLFRSDKENMEGSGARVKVVQVLGQTMNPMSRMNRWRHNVTTFILKTEATVDASAAVITNSERAEVGEAEEAPAPTQYRLTASRRKARSYYKRFKVALGMGGGSDESTHAGKEGKWYDPNTALTKYLYWSFRTSFLFLFLSSAVSFFFMICLFAGLIAWAGRNNPQCIQMPLGDFYGGDTRYKDAFSLSWTTFTTVGYGLIYPNISTNTPSIDSCKVLTFICSLEAFVGILFGGFVGAIVFGKVSRIQSVAQVIFSDPIVVRYGPGIESFEDDEDEEDDDAAAESKTDEERKDEFTQGMGDKEPTKPKKIKKIPCPILELRIVNSMHSKKGGEIMDATLNVVASINAATACPTLLASSKAPSRKKKKRQLSKKTIGAPFTAAMKQLPGWGSSSSGGGTAELGATMMEAVTTSAMVDEGNSNLVARKVFCKLNVEAPDHPFFKRVWFVRHELNVESPLLTAKARRLVRKNKGFWPEELNHYQGVRESIQFHQLMVSMSGTSNSSASSVYGQTIYNFVDVVIGYRFATAIFRDNGGHIRVNTSLINDVLEQNNGGGEPLTFMEKEDKRVMDLEDTG